MDCRLPTALYDRLDPVAVDHRVSTPKRGVCPLIAESDGAAGAFPFDLKLNREIELMVLTDLGCRLEVRGSGEEIS